MHNSYKTTQAKLAEYYMTQGAMRILDHISGNGELVDKLHKLGESDKHLLVKTLIVSGNTIY